LQHTYPLIPSSGNTQLRVFSGIPDCEYRFSTNLGARESFTLKGLDYYYSGSVATSSDGTFKLTYTVESLTEGELPQRKSSASFATMYQNQYIIFGQFLVLSRTCEHF